MLNEQCFTSVGLDLALNIHYDSSLVRMANIKFQMGMLASPTRNLALTQLPLDPRNFTRCEEEFLQLHTEDWEDLEGTIIQDLWAPH